MPFGVNPAKKCNWPLLGEQCQPERRKKGPFISIVEKMKGLSTAPGCCDSCP
jgi:hypothetical protein